MAANTLGLNQIFPIYNEDGTPFHDLVLRKGVVDSVVMSLGDKITGDVFYKDDTLQVTMKEYVEYNGVHFSLVNPPTIVREGMVADNSELKGMTKYSFEFYHPMYQLSNFPFTDVATKTGEEKYLSQNKTFSWIGNPQDYIDKLNKNLQGTVWYVRKSDLFPVEKDDELSEVQQFDNVSVAEAIKRGYEIWGIPYIVSQLPSTDPLYAQGKRFVVEYGLPSNEIYENESARQLDTPFVFQMGKGVGLKNNSRTPRNNKIVTRIAGYGSEDNVPYGYPQIVWTGNQDWDYTINNNPNDPNSYPIYKGIVGGQYVKLIKHPFTRTHLMPSVFTETVNKKVNPNAVGYDPTIEIKDYYDAVATQEYPYVNEINLQAPSYESHEFADIKPEFDSESSIGIISAIPLNPDLTPADHWDDSMDDDGNYLQSYFQITLPQLNFDLYACAAITQEMQINMRSGACIGCTFPIQVDWDDYKKNFYDEDGNFVPDGAQRDLTKYPKSNLGQINVVVQKDNSTFGTLMPNIYQKPVANDLFVFIGISLPLSYITDAEERLDDAMKTYMLENNVFYFDYPLKFDEHFLATHTYILEQIRPNSIIRFDYGGVEQHLFVKQLTVKYGNAALPQYDITLTDNIEVVLNQIGQVADDVEKLSSLISVLRQSYSRNVWNELAKKLSKTQDDTAQGYIRFLKGLQVGSNFVPDILGEGGVLRMRDDGKVELVTDILYARVKAYFDTVEIREYKHTAGNRIASVAGNKCVRVAWFNSSNVELEQTPSNLSSVAYFRCYFRASDGDDTVRNNFSIGDQAYCHVTSIATGSDNPEEKGLNQKHFWRLVIGRNTEGTLTEDGEAYIDLSNRATETIGGVSYEGYQSGSDVPQSQDDIIQLGNVNDTTRQGAIVEYVTGTDAPSYQIYQGINSFSLNGKNQIGFGYNTGTGRAYMNVYGDFRFGSRNNNGSYIKYNSQTGNLEIKAHVEFTNSDAELDTLVQEHQRDDSYDDSWIQPAIDELQDQIDGAIETYYMVGEPALNLPPVISTQEHPYDEPWLDGTETPEERTKILNNHVGDLYYDKDTGHGYRFLYDDNSRSFVWVRLTDEDIEAALEAANNAQATADGKMTIYSVWGAWVKNSINTLKVGDLFIPANDTTPTQGGTTYYARKVYKCIVAGQNSFSEIKYTDDTALNNFVSNTYNPFVTTIEGQVDRKAETWRQATNPASAWTTDADKIKHIGDLWMDTSSNGGKKTYIYVDKGSGASPRYAWEAQDVPDEVFNEIDGKSSIFVSQPSSYKANDLWILAADTTVNGVAYKQGEVLTSSSDSNSFVASHWTKKVRYTDDSAFNGYINAILNGSGSSGDAATVAAAQKAIKDALGGGTIVDGGLLLTSLIAMRKKNQDNTYTTWAGISGMYQDNVLGGGLAAWYGGNMIDKETLTAQQIAQGWSTVRWAKSVDRFDGSGYRADGNITWNEQGQITIKNITTLSDSQNTNILNELATFNSAFSFGTSGQGSTTALYITPNVPFQRLYIGTSDANKKEVATQEWVGNNYVTKAFFEAIFKPEDSSGNRVSTNGTTSGVLDRLKILVGAYTDQYLSALGLSNSSGGGGTGDVTWDLLANNSDTRQIALSHLTSALSSYATTSQLAGYLPLTGGTVSGSITVNEGISTYSLNAYTISANRIEIAGSGVATQSWVTTQLGSYNPTTNFKTINGNSIIGTGNITISGGSGNYLPLTGGTLTGNLYINDRLSISAQSGSPEDPESYDFYLENGVINIDDRTVIERFRIKADSIIKNGGTSSQFLKADGSVDSNSYLPLTGGTLTGFIDFNSNYAKIKFVGTAQSENTNPQYFCTFVNNDSQSGLTFSAASRFKLSQFTNDAGYINSTELSNQLYNYTNRNDTGYYHWAGNGVYAWCRIAVITTTDAYINYPITFELSARGSAATWVQVKFQNSGYADPPLEYIKSLHETRFHIKKVDTSTWELYWNASDGFWGVLALHRVFRAGGPGVTIKMDSVSEPSGATPASKWFVGIGDTIDFYGNVNNVVRFISGETLDCSGNFHLSERAGSWNIFDSNNNVLFRVVSTTGNIGIGTSSPSEKLDVNGIAKATGGFLAAGGKLMTSYGQGSETYTILEWSVVQNDGVYLECPNKTNSLSGEHLPIVFGWRGGVYPFTIENTGKVALTNGLRLVGSTSSIIFSNQYTYISYGSSSLKIVNETSSDIIIGDYDNRNYTSIVNDLEGAVATSGYTIADQTWLIGHDGNAYFKSVGQQSDIRYKNVIGDVALSLYNVANAPIFKFTWKDETKETGQHIGTAAQYWQTILPELVSMGTEKNPKMSMQYDVVALASVITVAKTVVSHEERIKILENENKALRCELEKLRESA